MNFSTMVYINLALVAGIALVYTQWEGNGVGEEGRFHAVYITTIPEGSVDAPEIESAIQAVELDWNSRVTVLHTSNDAPALARALKQAVALEPQGISMPGHPDEAILLPFVVEAQRQGIRVTFHTTPLPGAERRFQRLGSGYAGDRGEAGGRAFVQLAAGSLNIQPESRVLVAGTEAEPVPGFQLYGCLAQLRALGNAPEYLPLAPAPGSLNEAPTLSGLERRITEGTLPEVIFWDAGPVEPLITLLENAGVGSNDVRVATFVPLGPELLEDEVQYLKLQAVERHFMTCYLSLVQLHLAERHGLAGLQISTNGV